MRELERITARRSELDTLAEELAKQLGEVQAEREDLVVAERVLNRLADQDLADAETAGDMAPTPVRVAGRAKNAAKDSNTSRPSSRSPAAA